MRRLTRLLAPLVLLALLASPWLLPARVFAQAQVVGPPFNGVLITYTASVGAVNTAANVPLFSALIPAGLLATPGVTNVAAVVGGTGGVVPTGWTNMPAPLHLSLKGTVQTTGTPVLNMGVSYGKGVANNASVAIINGFTMPTLPSTGGGTNPFNLDCWVTPVATASGVGVAPGSVFLTCSAQIASAAQVSTGGFSGPLHFVQATYSGPSFSIASPQELNVIMNWSAASAVNAIYIQSATITMGH